MMALIITAATRPCGNPSRPGGRSYGVGAGYGRDGCWPDE